MANVDDTQAYDETLTRLLKYIFASLAPRTQAQVKVANIIRSMAGPRDEPFAPDLPPIGRRGRPFNLPVDRRGRPQNMAYHSVRCARYNARLQLAKDLLDRPQNSMVDINDSVLRNLQQLIAQTQTERNNANFLQKHNIDGRSFLASPPALIRVEVNNRPGNPVLSGRNRNANAPYFVRARSRSRDRGLAVANEQLNHDSARPGPTTRQMTRASAKVLRSGRRLAAIHAP